MSGEEVLAALADQVLEEARLAPLMPSNDLLRTIYHAESKAALQLCRDAGVKTPEER